MSESNDQHEKTTRRSGRRLVLATLAVLLLCSLPFAWRYYRVAALQGTLARNCEIAIVSENPPGAISEFVEANLQDLLRNRGSILGEQEPHIVYPERVRAMFCGNITAIGIYYPEDIRGDLGAALLRFGGLKRLVVFENEETLPSEASYKLLCERLRSAANLEELELGGSQLTCDALAPLAGHPKLKKLHLSYSVRLTTDVLQTVKALPALQVLEINSIYGPDEEQWKSPALHARFREALPGVTLTLPQP